MKWVALDRPQRIATLLGLFVGGSGAAFVMYVGAAFNPLSFVFFLPFLVPMLGSFSLLYLPMSDERRGVIGFLTVLAALAPLLFLALFLLRIMAPRGNEIGL